MVNNRISEFSLPNSRDQTTNIQEFENNLNVIVVLLRDIRWPFCRAHIFRLAKYYHEFQRLNTEIFPILVDSLKNAQKMEEKYAKRKFPIYYDSTGEIVKMLKQQKIWYKLGRMPGLLIIDKQAIIRWAYYSDNMHDIPKNEEILKILTSIEEIKQV